MEHVEESKKRRRGRPRKEEVKKHGHMFRLNEADSEHLLHIYKASEAKSMSQFLADKILNHSLKVIEIDKSAIDFVMLLTQFYAQFRRVKNNYNQLFALLVRELGEPKARQMIKLLEQPTLDFIQSMKEIEQITTKLREQCLPK